MISKIDKWAKLATEIADGKAINWQHNKGDYSDDLELLHELNAISKICKALKQVPNVTEEIHTIQVLFNWGHLQVIKKIGEGSYSDVYKAYDPILDRNVALKLLKPEKIAAYQSRAFIQEARRIAKVRNRHVLAIHGASIHDSKAGMWSDLITGYTLKNQQHRCHNYQIKDLIKVFANLTDALIAVHGAGLIHGDIKPSNVMQDEKGQYLLMDFGAGSEDDIAQSDSPEYITGTPLLMAPELFSGHAISPASDIYAFGALLFKLATNQYPVTGNTILEVADAHKKRKYASLQKLRPDLPNSICQLINLMLVVDPQQSPTAIEIKQKLNWITRAPQRRNKRVIISVIFISMLAGIIISSYGFIQANQARKIAEDERNKAQQEQENSETVNSFIFDMLNSVSKFGKGREVRVADMLDVAAQDVSKKFASQPYSRAAIHSALGNSYLSLRLPENAQEQLHKSIVLKQQLYPKDYESTLYSQMQLAMVYKMMGKQQKSITQIEEVIAIAKLDFKKNDSFIHLAKIRLAEYFNDIGKLQQAENLLSILVKTMQEPEESSNNYPFLIMQTLAENYLLQSKYQQSELMAKKALLWYEKYPNKLQTNLMAIKSQIAFPLIRQGKFDQAETMLRDVLQLSESLFGQNNTGYVSALLNLGGLLQESGKFEEAMSLLQTAFDLSIKIQGHKSKMGIIIGTNLANIKVSLKDWEGGEKMMRLTLVKAQTSLGKNHPQTLLLENNLAELLNNTQRFETAEKLARETLNKVSNNLSEDHELGLISLDNLAVSLSGQQQYTKAQKIHQQLLEKMHNTIGKYSPSSLLATSHYVDTLIQSGQKVEAKIQLQKLLLLQKKVLGDKHVDTKKSINILNKLIELDKVTQ